MVDLGRWFGEVYRVPGEEGIPFEGPDLPAPDAEGAPGRDD
jgi:hypothetical protein